VNDTSVLSGFNYSTNQTQALLPQSGLDVSQILMLPVFIFIITISVVGNALVKVSWTRFPSIWNPSNALLVSLASVDFLTGLITIYFIGISIWTQQKLDTRTHTLCVLASNYIHLLVRELQSPRVDCNRSVQNTR